LRLQVDESEVRIDKALRVRVDEEEAKTNEEQVKRRKQHYQIMTARQAAPTPRKPQH